MNLVLNPYFKIARDESKRTLLEVSMDEVQQLNDHRPHLVIFLEAMVKRGARVCKGADVLRPDIEAGLLLCCIGTVPNERRCHVTLEQALARPRELITGIIYGRLTRHFRGTVVVRIRRATRAAP